MARANYKCPNCKKWNGVNGCYGDGNREHTCKHCGCKVNVRISGNIYWRPSNINIATKRN